jgi:TPR repeat protein
MNKVISMWRNAADQGHAGAQCNLGVLYDEGHGVKQDKGEAVRLFRKAAKQGFAMAQYNLGAMYSQGQGVKQDYREAARLYWKAADQGHAAAQYNLGVLYYNGQGVKQDMGEALQWLRKAAAQGYAAAPDAVLLVEEKLRKQRQATLASQSSSSHTCANCGVAEAAGRSVALKPCSRCKAVVYCGKECQMQHWKAGGHKAVCK